MSEGLKKSALRIHGLSKADQEWILGNLPQEERSLLAVMLFELDEMNLPESSAVFSDLVEKESDILVQGNGINKYEAASKRDIINNASFSAVASILVSEPDWIIALVLLCGEWKWTDELIGQLRIDQREQVYEKIKKIPARLPLKLEQAVIDLLAEALIKKPTDPVNAVSSRFASLFGAASSEMRAQPLNLKNDMGVSP